MCRAGAQGRKARTVLGGNKSGFKAHESLTTEYNSSHIVL